ncbi:MAG TPA: VanZ family protein [Luteitalea sp.]|nr:VanZ family protein [Luteitalea sp.]
MSPAVRARVAWLPALGWAGIIFLLSSQPVLPSPPGVNDKLAHAIAYGILAAACLLGATAGHWRRVAAGTVGLALLIAVVYGASDEFHQSFVPGRTPDVADLLADTVGAVTALSVLWLSAILLRRRRAALRP